VDGAAWRRDRWLWGAIALGVVLRVIPLLLWDVGDCVRDECIFRSRAAAILDGEGLTTTDKGWLPAPGYPYLLALVKLVTTQFWPVKVGQALLGGACIALVHRIGDRLGGRRVAITSAMLFALHPTLIFFSGTLWVEPIYVFLLLAASEGMLRAREEGSPRAAILSGAAIGLAILFRGVATYLPPIFALAAVWPERGERFAEGLRSRWRHALAFGLAAVVTVAPWSIHASSRYGGFLVSDATAGHVLFLGNNEFAPVTFDYGNGVLTSGVYSQHLRQGRRTCDRDVPPVRSNACEVAATVDWIRANPGEFVRRVPMRLAQLFNPNSFLTRHVRWGYWEGLPFVVKEGIAVLVVLTSALVMVGGTAAAWARARGPYAVMAVGVVAYTCATIAVAYGMTRFRVPLEAMWLPYTALLLADPRGVLRALGESPARAAGLILTLPPLLALMAWYLPTGFPRFW